MVFCGLPLMSGRSGDTGNRLCQTGDRPKCYRAGINQLENQRIKLASLRFLAEDGETINHKREHPPGASEVLLAANRQRRAVFMKDCQCASAMAGVGNLAKKRSLAESTD